MKPTYFFWSTCDPGKITIYSGDSRGDGSLYSFESYRWVAAHEFGHTLGIGDMYTNSDYEGVPSIYNGYVGQWSVQERDIAKVLNAWNTGTFQKWG